MRASIRDPKKAGFVEIAGGKGSHRKYTHAGYAGSVTIGGGSGDDVERYREKRIAAAIESVKR